MREPLEKLGARIARCRERSGLSALALATRAGLSMNAVRNVERGLRVPRWDTLSRICRALGLSKNDRDALASLLYATMKPESDRSAMPRSSIPGLVVWKHLPYLLHALPCDDRLLPGFVPDEVLFQGVRVAASVLGWAALCIRPPTKRELSGLRDGFLEYLDRSLAARETDPAALADADALAPGDAAEALPNLWRTLLFTERAKAARWVRLLRKWSCMPAGLAGYEARIALVFRDSEHAQRFGLWGIDPDSACQLHDVLVSVRLAEMLDRDRDFTGLVSAIDPGLWRFKESADVLAASTADDYLRELSTLPKHRQRRLQRPSILEACNYTRVALRAYEVSAVGALIFRSEADAARGKLSELEAVFDKWMAPGLPGH